MSKLTAGEIVQATRAILASTVSDRLKLAAVAVLLRPADPEPEPHPGWRIVGDGDTVDSETGARLYWGPNGFGDRDSATIYPDTPSGPGSSLPLPMGGSWERADYEREERSDDDHDRDARLENEYWERRISEQRAGDDEY